MTKLLCVLAAAVAVASCVPATPAARIERHPEMFAALPAKHQEMVRQGVIAKGMNPDGVYLAWGAPSLRIDTYKDGKASERWDYTGSYPVYGSSFYGGYYGGYGYRRHYPYRGAYYPPYAIGWGPSVSYIPYCRSRVWFANQKVDGWERLQ
jgi:hypothetical protein